MLLVRCPLIFRRFAPGMTVAEEKSGNAAEPISGVVPGRRESGIVAGSVADRP